jgi:type 1 fimbria pilin
MKNKKLLVMMVVSTLISTSVWAQATAKISGTVRDQSGAVLPPVPDNVQKLR